MSKISVHLIKSRGTSLFSLICLKSVSYNILAYLLSYFTLMEIINYLESLSINNKNIQSLKTEFFSKIDNEYLFLQHIYSTKL